VFDVMFPELKLSVQAYCALTLVPLVLICQIRNLKYLVPFSALANLLILCVFGITMYFIFTDLPPVKDREMVTSVTQWPLFFSTVIFAMGGIGVVMPIENEMKNPKRFLGCPGVSNVAMVIIISLYDVFGFFGYVQYGDDVKGSITLNLPEDYIIAQSAKLIMAIVMFLSYALQMYVPMEMINRMLQKRKTQSYNNLIQVTIRTTAMVTLVAIAAAFPNLELVISLAGAIFFSILGLLFPAIIDTVYRWDRGLGKFNYVLWKNTFICIMCFIVLISGTYVSVVAMIEDFSSDGHYSSLNETLT
ncbi:proton-coupled amino acid transporter-like protein pathetic, partial [Hyposmocoma kahamanoa]|uniref:proton-coupled amino acid transporter-like protein pathetic n=1 Tax=Hyposmocoma kahamanoa TaxID=1477025 RepID=UPI000E6D6C60